ncbi:MAG: trypsin, partial [Blastocatellia bacterium]|nr:trypsin [Blastocatellia bacterium]
MTAVQLPLLELESSIRLRQVGILLACKATEQISLPLAKVDISARVADRIAEVTMKETFKNNLKEHLEAVYTFPLPGGGAVTSFEMRVGSRIVRGQVQERSAARRNYQQALEEGKRAALLEQERDDVFTVQVGNLPPGEEVTVLISYCERLPFFDDGTTELRLPMVVAPRYIPGSALERSSVGEGIEADTDLVPDASRISPPRLAEGFDAKVALSLEVELMKQGRSKQNEEIEDLSCSQHALRTRLSSGSVKVTLARTDELMNRDFVL